LLLLLLGLAACEATPDAWVEIRDARVAVELATDPIDQARGLGGRDGLDWDTGMYFVYDQAGFYGFWMKDMRFDIDIVWIREGRIVDLHPNVPHHPDGPGPTLRPAELADAVLEVSAGYAMAKGWQIGDRATLRRNR